jgi:hypothetical protein
MTDTIRGGCACGAVRYEATGAPVFQNHCQCLQCRKASGTGHGSYLSFTGGLRIDGEVRTFSVVADSGLGKRYGFCPTCGSPLLVTPDAVPGLVAVSAGSLDEPGRFAPVAVTYAGAAMAWDRQDPSLTQFEAMPPGS